MLFCRARPEDAILTLNFFISNAVIVGVPAFRGYAQLLKDFTRTIELEILAATHATGNFPNYPPVGAGLARRITCLIDLYDAAFAVGRHAFIFSPRRAWQDHVCIARAFRHEEINTNVKIQPLKRAAYLVNVRQTDHHIVAD